MDIRKFFGGSSASVIKNDKSKAQQKTESKTVEKSHKSEEKSSKKEQIKDSSKHKNAEKKVQKNETDKHKNDSGKRTRNKSKTDEKKNEKVEKKVSEEKSKVKPIEVINIDDDDSIDSPRKSSRERSKTRIDANGNEEIKEVQKGKKRRISSEEFEEEEVISRSRSKKGKKGHRILDSESDEEPVPGKSEKKKKRNKKKEAMYIDDSDEEKPKVKTIDSFFKTPSPHKTKPKESDKKTSEAKRTPVSAADFFGGASVKRVERKPSVKRKMEDREQHEDDDFEKTLLQLDDLEPKKKAKMDKTPEKSLPKGSPVKSELSSSPGKPSLASKLASRMKTVVPETPERDNKKPKASVTVPETPKSEKVSPAKQDVKETKRSPSKISFTKTPSPTKPVPEKKSPATIHTPQSSKAKTSPNKTSPSKAGGSPDTPKTAIQRKTTYRSYMTREGPQALGSKEIPEGQENCMEGLTFVLTGVMESLERDEAKHLVEKYGGKVTTTLSKKTSYLVAGRDSGVSKLDKASQLGTKILDEDGLLKLVKTLPGKKSKYTIQAEQELKKELSVKKRTSEIPAETAKTPVRSASESSKVGTSSAAPIRSTSDKSDVSLMWVDKYKPTTLKQIIGQQGDKSNAKKLHSWLINWHKNQVAGKKPAGKFFGKDDGSGMKAALLSGPPGIGKTTTATLVCKEAGFSFVELNASDTRSKKSMQGVVANSLDNQTMVEFMHHEKSSHGHKHCLVMDEVDGMAGNEDRGGIQELVQLIKHSKIPIICMCNDRNHPKMRTLSNYCFDLRFYKPRVEQIKAAMMSLAFKEGLKIPPPALNEIILGANQDIRQVIHNLSMWTAADKSMTYEEAKEDANKAKKDFKLGPFDVCRKVFVGGDETAGMTINDKSDLFFHDYSIAPLFVQENYPTVIPFSARGHKGKHLSLLAQTADSICDGDLVDKTIRSQGSWSLLPTAAMYASVIPGEYMRGSFPQMVAFPSWLGKNSSRGKTDRILQELRTHMRLQISGDKRSLNMEYLPSMRHSLTGPLVKRDTEGVGDVIKLMDNYDIIKEDFDNIMEVTKWPNSSDPMSRLSTKTKAAFTRAYNKEVHLTPYSTGAAPKKGRGKSTAVAEEDELLLEGEAAAAVEESDEEEDKLEADTMIKMKKKTAADKAKGKESQGSKGKGGVAKGKGPDKGKGQKKGKR